MTKIAISPNVNGTGTFTLAAPDSNTDRTLTLPDAGGEVFSQGNIVGTVSQSAGDPTGAIIQRGSNANGEFVKYADGTLICTRDFSKNNGSTADQTVSFPATFASPVDVGLSVLQVSSFGTQIRIQSLTASSVTVMVQNVSDGSANTSQRNGRVIAIGRWF